MLKVVEATIDEEGAVQLIEPLQLPKSARLRHNVQRRTLCLCHRPAKRTGSR